MQAKAFCEAMQTGTTEVSVKAELLRAALKAHSSNTKLAMIGQGVDRLLLGLEKISEDTTGAVPEVFLTGKGGGGGGMYVCMYVCMVCAVVCVCVVVVGTD